MDRRTLLTRIGVIVGLVAYLGTGLLYLTSGLVVPGPALLLLWAAWLAGMWGVGRLVRAWSLWTLAAPVAAIAFWAGFVSLGSWLFDWTA